MHQAIHINDRALILQRRDRQYASIVSIMYYDTAMRWITHIPNPKEPKVAPIVSSRRFMNNGGDYESQQGDAGICVEWSQIKAGRSFVGKGCWKMNVESKEGLFGTGRAVEKHFNQGTDTRPNVLLAYFLFEHELDNWLG